MRNVKISDSFPADYCLIIIKKAIPPAMNEDNYFSLNPAYRLNDTWANKIRFALLNIGKANVLEIAAYIHRHETTRSLTEIQSYVQWYLEKMEEVQIHKNEPLTIHYSI